MCTDLGESLAVSPNIYRIQDIRYGPKCHYLTHTLICFFSRYLKGRDINAYYHEEFLKGHEELVYQMKRSKRGYRTPVRRTSGDEDEPNFYDLVVYPALPSVLNPSLASCANPARQDNPASNSNMSSLHGQTSSIDMLLPLASEPAVNSARQNAARAAMPSRDSSETTLPDSQMILASMFHSLPDNPPTSTGAMVNAFSNYGNNQLLSMILSQSQLQPQIASRVPGSIPQHIPHHSYSTEVFGNPTSVPQQMPTQMADPDLLWIIQSIALILGSSAASNPQPPR
jgi:hypothetical protein